MKRLIPFLLLLVTSTAFAATGLNKMKKLIALLILNVLLISSTAFAATYYAAASGGGGAASCVDNGANVCTLARAVVVASTGTNTIECGAGTYSITTELSLDSGNTGANLTFTCATANGCTWGSSGTSTVVDIETTMVSGTVTFDDINIDDGGADYSIRNQSPEVNVVYKNGTCNNTDASAGSCIWYALDSTNKISLTTGEDTVTNLKTGATTNVKVAQKFVVGGSNITVNRASFKLQKKCGNLNLNCDSFVSGESWDYRNGDTLTATIETDSAGSPSGTPVTNGTAVTILAFDVESKSDQWAFFTFSSNVSLTASTTYHLVLTGSYTASTSNYIAIATDTGNGYASGDCATNDGTTWTACSAGTDILFTIDRNHSRDLTVEDSVLTTRASSVVSGWADRIIVRRNSITTTAGGGISISPTGLATTSGYQQNYVLVEDNVVSVTNSASTFVSAGVSGFLFTYTRVLIIKGNTGTTETLTQPKTYIERIFILDNDMDLTYNGNTPLLLGFEVNGTDPQDNPEAPFKQIVIDGNTFRYTSSAHNHLMLFAMGAENGILRNNTLTVNPGSGGWGVILKANGWLIDHNSIYGVAPALYVSGTNNSRVTNNTLVCSVATTDGCLLVRSHQDSVYGGNHGLPLNNYIADNIVYSEAAVPALDYGNDTTRGTGRDTQQWSNYLNYNTYLSPLNTNQSVIETVAATESITEAEGIATQQATWQSESYSDINTISIYNDENSSFTNPGLIDPENGNFKPTSSTVKNGGSVPNTSIGSYQSSGGRKWIGRGVS